MKMNSIKYLLVIIIAVVFIVTNCYTRSNAYRLKKLMHVLDKTDTEQAFTDNGRQNIVDSYSCLNDSAFSYLFGSRHERSIGNRELLKQLNEIMTAFPIHLLETRGDKKNIELDALFNCPNPVVITFMLVNDRGTYKINGIKNLCAISEKINLWYDQVYKRKNASI